ncbi:MAG: cation:proton antiporter [Halothermotrichaceae bacterium]
MNSNDIVDQLKILQEWFLLNQAGNKMIYVVGILIFLALLLVLVSKKYRIPIVVGYVFLGILLSVDVIKALPFLTSTVKNWYIFSLDSFEYITDIALAFIAFTIGSELSLKIFKKVGKSIGYITILQGLGTFVVVTAAILAIGQPLYLALILGAIASATAPAATVMVLQEYKAKGVLTSMIMAVVGLDDALALILFSFIKPIALIQFKGTGDLSFTHMLADPLIEILGSILLGLTIGYISQKLITDFEDSTKKIMTVVSTIIGCLALSIAINLSPLITNMAVGFAFRNFARKNLGIGDYMDTLTTPLYAMFFILAGTEIRFSRIATAGFFLIAAVYFLSRFLGKIVGASLGAYIGKAPEKVKKYIGLGLLPQSGVAIAMAYTVQKEFVTATNDVGMLVFNVLLFTAALTEVFGPFATKYAIMQAGEAEGTVKRQTQS